MREAQGTWAGVLLDDNKVSVSGWTEGAFTASSARRDQLPMGFNYRANDFLLQQNWVRVERAVDDKRPSRPVGSGWTPSCPGRTTGSRSPGLLDRQLTATDGGPNRYGIDPVQFYGEAYLPHVGRGLDVKAGRFFCQFGVESIDTTLNPFVSRSYTFIYNPFTHTGLLTTLKLDDAWSVQNGLVAGSDVFLDPAANPTYFGGVKWAPPDGRASALLEVILGSGRYDQGRNFHNPEILDLVLTRKLSDRLTWQPEGLYGFTTHVPDTGFADWFGAVNYLSYRLAPEWTGNARLEFFDDCQGQRTGFRGLYTAATAGVTYKPRPYLLVRPELRYDTHANARPFEDRHGVFTAAVDFVARW